MLRLSLAGGPKLSRRVVQVCNLPVFPRMDRRVDRLRICSVHFFTASQYLDPVHDAPPMPDNNAISDKCDGLRDAIAATGGCVVAFSGGVDSAVVAKAAQLALANRAVAVTGVSASLAEGELAVAHDVARQIGIRHEILQTGEVDDPRYRRNDARRCFFCKSELYVQLRKFASDQGLAAIANGTNRDDWADYRPGLEAAEEVCVMSPLADQGLGKTDVRELARWWGLPVWDKPASPCLSSRVAYGEEVTPQRLGMVDQAEQLLREYGFSVVRVRYHKGDMARIELPQEVIGRFVTDVPRGQLVARFKQLGFRFVTFDLEGFRSGSLNAMIPVDELSNYSDG